MSQFTVDLSSIDEFEASGEDAKMFSDEDIADMMFIEGNVAAPESKEAKSPEVARFEIGTHVAWVVLLCGVSLDIANHSTQLVACISDAVSSFKQSGSIRTERIWRSPSLGPSVGTTWNAHRGLLVGRKLQGPPCSLALRALLEGQKVPFWWSLVASARSNRYVS